MSPEPAVESREPPAMPTRAEALRYFPPLTMLVREAMQDTTLGGQAIRAGDKIIAIDVSGNFDDAHFPNAAQFDHDRLPTFGVGKDVTDADWRRVFRQLAAMGYLAVDLEGYGGLKLTAASRAVLKGETAVTLRRAPEKKRLRKSAQERSRARNAIAPVDDTLWQALREKRLALSKELGVPPYVIFHDATLQEMLARRPATLDELRGISGVGERKLAKFGAAFLDVLQAHAS